jgi:hypothetical protein
MEAVRKRDEAEHGIIGETATEVPEALFAPRQSVTAPAMPQTPQVREVVVCSSTGELLYEWKSSDTKARCGLLVLLGHFSERIQSLLAIGALGRVDFHGGADRMIARLQEQNGVFIRAG